MPIYQDADEGQVKFFKVVYFIFFFFFFFFFACRVMILVLNND